MARASRDFSYRRCAFCDAPLAFNSAGVVAWRVGNRFACNEFCAEGVPSDRPSPEAMPRAERPKQPFSLN
jgi:hypothetical protein